MTLIGIGMSLIMLRSDPLVRMTPEVKKLTHTTLVTSIINSVLSELNRVWSRTTRGTFTRGFRVERSVTSMLLIRRLIRTVITFYIRPRRNSRMLRVLAMTGSGVTPLLN